MPPTSRGPPRPRRRPSRPPNLGPGQAPDPGKRRRRGAEARHRPRRMDRPALADAAGPNGDDLRHRAATGRSPSSSVRPPTPDCAPCPDSCAVPPGAAFPDPPFRGGCHARRPGLRRHAALRRARRARVRPGRQPAAAGSGAVSCAPGPTRSTSASCSKCCSPVMAPSRTPGMLAGALLDAFGTAPRALAARSGPAAHRARPLRGRHRRPQGRRGARHPHGAGKRARNPAPVPRQLRQGHRVLPRARGPSRGRGVPDFVFEPEESI